MNRILLPSNTMNAMMYSTSNNNSDVSRVTSMYCYQLLAKCVCVRVCTFV